MPRTIMKAMLRYTILALISCLLLTACSEIGKQAPQLWSARFTADGSRMVYTYDVFTVLQYHKRGGSISRSGSRKAYMDVRDVATGRSLLAEPYCSKSTLSIVGLVGDLCALSGSNVKTTRNELYIVDITTGKERFNPDELSKLNGGLQLDPSIQYVNDTGKPGFVFGAQDARAYFIDPYTGKAELAETGARIHPVLGNNNPKRIGSRNEGTGFTDGPRQRLEMNGRYSIMDFISPTLGAELRDGESERVPVSYQGNPFVISHSTTTTDFSWEINMLDAATLDQVWSATLVNVPNAAPFYWEDPMFHVDGDALLVQTATELSRFDAATGTLKWTVQVP